MSRKLETLEAQYNSNPSLPNLIEFLEECKRELQWAKIIEVTSIRSGSETPEVHFYRGLALINLDKKKGRCKGAPRRNCGESEPFRGKKRARKIC